MTTSRAADNDREATVNNTDSNGLVLLGGSAGVTGVRALIVARTDTTAVCTDCGWDSDTPSAGMAAFAAARHAGAHPAMWRTMLREWAALTQLQFQRDAVVAAATAVDIADSASQGLDIDWSRYPIPLADALEPLAHGVWYLGLLPQGFRHRKNSQ